MEKVKEEIKPESGAAVPRRHGKVGCNRCKKAGSDITGPVYFLLREQAKSQVAIRDLQHQLKIVEGNQEDMVLAINGIQNHLLSCSDRVNELPLAHGKYLYDIDEKLTPTSHLYSLPNQSNNSKVHQRTKNFIQLDRVEENVLLPSVPKSNRITYKPKQDGKSNMSVDTVIPETDNKQDSGLESDCHNQVNESGYSLKDRYANEYNETNESNFANSRDELSLLLDIINQRGQHLQQEVTELKRKRQIMINETNLTESRQEIKKLHESNAQLQHQLTAVEEEKDKLRVQLSHLETASQEMEDERKRLQERLEAAISEKQQLEGRIHGLHCQFVKAANSKNENCSDCLITPVDTDNLQLRKNGKLILNSEQNRHKVSSILKENNVLELQRQLLTYTVENEVLQTKLEQTLQMHKSKVAEWEKAEILFKNHIKQLTQEKELLQKQLETSRVDFATVEANGKMLERALHAVSYSTAGNNKIQQDNLIQNGSPSKVSGNGQQQDHINALMKDCHLQDFGDKTHSLPVIPLTCGESNSPLFYKRGHCDCDHVLSGLLKGRIEIKPDQDKQELINFNDSHDAVRTQQNRKESTPLTLHFNGKCKDCYFTPISSGRVHSPVNLGPSSTLKSSSHPSLIDAPIENRIWNGVQSEQREFSIHSGPSSSINQEVGIPSSTSVWDPPTLIDIQSPAKSVGYPYYKDQNDMDSIRSEFDPLSAVNNTALESQHEIIDSLNLYTPLGQKQLSSTGDSLHSTSLEPGVSAKFVPQVRKYGETKDVFSNGVSRCRQPLLKKNVKIEKAWPISSSHPDVMKNISTACDIDDNQHYHSILGFMSTTEGETLL